ncbi:23 kDa integral membrane protein-like isoform X2 [Tenebrio molitor]|uniref:23 kDa integral membrane protein-like isoform X2 n=1 Tax=Tenebrio molitor TaxID=7067 RepID=UPI003624A4E3
MGDKQQSRLTGKMLCISQFARYVIFIFNLIVTVALGTLGILKIEPEDFVAETGTLIRELFDSKDKEPMYTLQAQYGCCGVNGSNDYTLTVDGYPVSCCAKGNYPCFHPIEEGCASVFSGVIKQYVEIVSFVAIGVAGVEVISIIFAFLVRRTNTHHTFKMKEPLEDETSI